MYIDSWRRARAGRGGGVDKRKSDREHRRALIREWRAGIAALGSEKDALGTEWYESLRPHLTQDEILKVEGDYMFLGGPARGRKAQIDLLADAVTRVEREWNL